MILKICCKDSETFIDNVKEVNRSFKVMTFAQFCEMSGNTPTPPLLVLDTESEEVKTSTKQFYARIFHLMLENNVMRTVYTQNTPVIEVYLLNDSGKTIERI